MDEDWSGRERFAHEGDTRKSVPLPNGVPCYAIAATLGEDAGNLSGRILGDGLVPLDSALGRHAEPARTLAFPDNRQRVIQGVNHLDLLSDVAVCEQIRQWLAPLG